MSGPPTFLTGKCGPGPLWTR